MQYGVFKNVHVSVYKCDVIFCVGMMGSIIDYFDKAKSSAASKIQKLHCESEVKIDMEAESISGKLVKPDGVEQYWWNGVNYHNVIPEQFIDAVLASEKMEDKKQC